MPESASYRFIVVISQYVFWLLGQILRLRYDIRAHRPTGIFEHDERCLILSPTHKAVLDPWLLMIALDSRHFRTLVLIRVLAMQTFTGRLRW